MYLTDATVARPFAVGALAGMVVGVSLLPRAQRLLAARVAQAKQQAQNAEQHQLYVANKQAVPLKERVDSLIARVKALSPSTVERPTLVYFKDIVGILWPVRCLLHLSGVEYDYIEVSLFEWLGMDWSGDNIGGAALKAAFRNSHIPRYVDCDADINQSLVLFEYLAQKHGLLGDTPGEALMVKEVMCQCYELWTNIFYTNMRVQPGTLVPKNDEWVAQEQANWAPFRAAQLTTMRNYLRLNDANNSSGHSGPAVIVGARLSMADLHAYNVLNNWYRCAGPVSFAEQFPDLEAYVKGIAAVPGIADYIAQKQEPSTWFPYRFPHFVGPMGHRLTVPGELSGL